MSDNLFRKAYGYDYSENGWRMVNRNACVVANPVPHSNTAPVRGGDAATILNAWLIWYHHNVEPITSSVWGWSLENTVKNSNHLSGTAVDVNAPQYPWGVRVMPADRIAKVRRGLKLFEGSVFWGADWAKADEMHYQLGWPEGDRRVAAFAKRLSDGYLGIYGKPAPPVNEIDAEAKRAAAWLGARITKGEMVTPDGKGRFAQFAAGYVYFHPNARAHKRVGDRAVAVPLNIFETWAGLGWEAGVLGYPIERHHVVAGVGDIQGFQGGVVYRKYGQPGYFVTGRIWDRFAATDFERGNGWPQSNEHDFDGGQVQRFEKLDMVYNPSEVTRLARGKVAGEWQL
ncbi:lysin A [Gordonia phage Huffy]|nr:lysin A [Gordonia phage Huffy]AQY55709.1 lysin B [Gordonia phage DinoDaryn]